ncbi:MAG: nucleotide sugar dehydrogenase [Spirochaetales bacterium]|nr:nucleotide sugar dehydrogenase [Spirochaetales bacterium]
MTISIFGLGYVGCVSGACLADLGHTVIGVDINETKVTMINEGKSPIIEEDIDTLIEKVVSSGALSASTNTVSAVEKSDVAIVCVGTPSRKNGSLEFRAVMNVSHQIGEALREISKYFVVIVRSTVLPGTVENIVIPALEKSSGKKAGTDFGVCMNPEFLREGTSVYDFYNPPKNVIGEFDSRSGDVVENIYGKIQVKTFRVPIKIAEMVKYCDNTFHALKIAYANEIGNICKEFEIDSHKVMDIFCSDTKLNIAPTYLKPGFAFGGSCLPKDLRALTYESKLLDLETPVLNSILSSNKRQITKTVNKLLEYKGKVIGFLGLSFKSGTDDLRESPIVEVIETVIGKGLTVKIYDKNVSIARLIGANKQYIEEEIPHISSLMEEKIEDLIRDADVLVIANKSEEFKNVVRKAGKPKVIIDLVRIVEDTSEIKADYYGICW